MAKRKDKDKKAKRAPRCSLKDPALYISRELSWLEFNDRVLREGLSADLPLLERLKFLSIVSSNLDEFFMVRVAGLRQQRAAGIRKRDLSGLTPVQQLGAISERVHRMVAEQSAGICQVTEALRAAGVHFLGMGELTAEQRKYADSFFRQEVRPILTPLAVDQIEPCPVLPHLCLLLAVRLTPTDGGEGEERIAVVPVPGGSPRFVALPARVGLHLVRLEDVIAANVGSLFPGHRVEAHVTFRTTRDADVAIQEDAAGDLLEAIETAVRARQRREPVRLEISAKADRALRKWLMAWSGLKSPDVYDVDGMLDATSLMEIALRPGLEKLKVPDWPPQPPRDLLDEREDLFQALQERDVLLFHPYESFSPVVRLMEQAAEDPSVLAIKQTLYRTSGDSPVIAALERAAQNGKQVIVLVELKARFDEARNIVWARRLEEAGAFVLYGISGYKTHSKALLIVRREAHRIRRYVHLATGNYNDKTAKLYSDIGFMTSDNDFAADTAAFFNLLTGYSEQVGFSKLTIAPTGLRNRFVELIEREVASSSPDEPGLIMAKVNSLHDKGIARALYRASQAGVRIRLNVRGICCLRPGIEGVSENIDVVSIVDRYLEHARIYYFRNAGHEEVYLSSADWMARNLDRRLEILFPVPNAKLRRRLIGLLETFFADNVKARRLLPDGSYERVQRKGKPIRAQEAFYRAAVEAVRTNAKARVRFQPVTRPDA
ncbi:MAG TPA: polyphosphate kinase 1 [Phycisphaerae bacterium]|nr:polyphosphate kinase 1 [Phycisphaerae bacterium]